LHRYRRRKRRIGELDEVNEQGVRHQLLAVLILAIVVRADRMAGEDRETLGHLVLRDRTPEAPREPVAPRANALGKRGIKRPAGSRNSSVA